MLCWGIAALMALAGVVVVAYRSLPWRRNVDARGSCIYAIALSLSLWMMLIGELQNKEFALGLGLIAAGQCWRIFAGEAASIPMRSRAARAAPRELTQPFTPYTKWDEHRWSTWQS